MASRSPCVVLPGTIAPVCGATVAFVVERADVPASGGFCARCRSAYRRRVQRDAKDAEMQAVRDRIAADVRANPMDANGRRTEADFIVSRDRSTGRIYVHDRRIERGARGQARVLMQAVALAARGR